MKTAIQSFILLAAIIGAQSSRPESGADCVISASVACRLRDGTNRVCSVLENEPYENCGEVEVMWKYTYCNRNEQKMYFHEDLFEPLLHNVDVSSVGFNKDEMAVTECRDVSVPRTINSCEKRNTVASLKLEGNLSNKERGGDNYCYDFAFLKQKVGQPPSGPILPVENPADISLGVMCRYESIKGSTFFNKDCSGIRDIVPNTASDCVVPVEYTYTVENKSTSGKAKVQAIIDETTTNVLTAAETLDPFMRSMTTIPGTIDICKLKGAPVVKKAVALAASYPTGMPGSASASLTIATP